MKKLTLTLLIAFAATAQLATAMNYAITNDDLLLVFRKANAKDVEFDIGTVSNYLGLAAGTMRTVNFATNTVFTNYSSSYSGVQFALAACTSDSDAHPRVWLTDADLANTPSQLTVDNYSALSSTISSVGNQASLATGHNPATAWVDIATDPASYSYIVSPGDPGNIPTWQGVLSYILETNILGTVVLNELALNPGTPPGKVIGRFTWNANGSITFTAGAPPVALTPSDIVQFTRANGVSSITFGTTNGNHYQLLYSTNVAAPAAAWLTNNAAGTVTGDNTFKIFTDTTADPTRFYRIESF